MKKALLEFVQPVAVTLYVLYPGLFWIWPSDGSALPFAVAVLGPVVLGLLIGRYWAALLAFTEVLWFALGVVKGRQVELHDWHDHTVFEVIALGLAVTCEGLLVAVGVRLHRALGRRIGALPPSSPRVARPRLPFRALRPVIVPSALLMLGGALLPEPAGAVASAAGVATYFAGWFVLQRRFARRQPVDVSSAIQEEGR
jgi:hypothetical protein